MTGTEPLTAAGLPPPSADAVVRSLCHAVRGRLSRLYLRVELAALDDQQGAAMLSELDAIDGLLGMHRDLLQEPPTRPPQSIQLLELATTVLGASPLATRVELDPSLATTLNGWPEVLCAALRPLLINALQHGVAPVRLHARPLEQSLVIVCEDAGQGFEPAELTQLAIPFRVPRGRHGGAGIGLAVAHRMAGFLSGSLHAYKTASGFQVCLRLPLG